MKIEVKTTLYSSRVKLSDCYALGKLYTVTVERDVRMLVTARLGLDSAPSTASRFLRASIGNVVYYSKGYTRTKTRNSHTICYRGLDNSEKFGLVQYFLSLAKETVAIITPLSPTHNYPFPRQLVELKKRIVPVTESSAIDVIPVRLFLFKCVYITSCAVHYVATPPYVQLYDD